jgi:hypothetical protein
MAGGDRWEVAGRWPTVACSTTCARLCPGALKPVGGLAVVDLDAGRWWSWVGDSCACRDRVGACIPPLSPACERALSGCCGLVTVELVADLSIRDATRGIGGNCGGKGDTGEPDA